MRVINRPSKPEVWPKTIVCPNCKCEIEYDGLDLEDIEGGIGFNCPDCGKEIMVEKVELHKYPESFYHFGEDEYTVCLSDKEVQIMIDAVVRSLENAEVGEYYFTGTGDTIVFGFKQEDETIIYVCKNYWEEHYDFKD